MRVELLVQGMTCAACAAKVAGRLNAIANVSATVNIATEKATVTAPPSVLLSLFPAYRFPRWHWVLIALAIPVAGWAAWPFHRAALKNGTGARPGDETGTKEHTASCLE